MAEKTRMKKGFSLLELCIALALMGIVAVLAVSAIQLTSKAFVGASQELKAVSQDVNFASRLCETIRETGTAFTIPKNSFIEENLTAGWNYLGLMDNVHIPAYASRTGKEIDSAEALVYIEYIGPDAPSGIPMDSNLISTSDGYFLQTVLGHTYTDISGNKCTYSLVFTPTDPLINAAQTISYEFFAEMTDDSGNTVGIDRNVDIETMLGALNAIQVVYQGSNTNPATALAFRSDFLPVYSATLTNTDKPAATVTLVLDISGSMDEGLESGQTRLAALKQSAKEFISSLSANENINICIIPFSSYGACDVNFDGSVPSKFIYNAYSEQDKLEDLIDDLVANGGTNVGDGLRLSYYQLKAWENSGAAMGTNFLVLMTDGAMNAWSIKRSGASNALNFYDTSRRMPPYVAYNNDNRNIYIETGEWFRSNVTITNQVNTKSLFSSAEDAYEKGARAYMRMWATKIVNDFNADTTLISVCDGMSDNDKAALQDAFGTDTVFDVSSLTDFQTTFQQINNNINNVMWAFTGPRI